ncbi:carbohydrate ABC transporter permease [Pseudonocardia nigra]|uniref:carbohydrate ABC transporter permease n=1 Tax=Pseudonocardia nigra TaxID=1921578 RepID=UPI001C5EBB3D|nr:sugar ABC transporter permease [Pseudonocardia nigra]
MSTTVVAAPVAARPATRLRADRRHSLTHPPRTGLLLVAPALLMIAVFVLAPLLFALGISFTNWPLIGEVEFSGFANYVAIGNDAGFVTSVLYTLLYTAVVTLPILVLGYALAVLVRSRRRGATLLRTVFFLPFVVGLTTLSFITLLEAQPTSGRRGARGPRGQWRRGVRGCGRVPVPDGAGRADLRAADRAVRGPGAAGPVLRPAGAQPGEGVRGPAGVPAGGRRRPAGGRGSSRGRRCRSGR